MRRWWCFRIVALGVLVGLAALAAGGCGVPNFFAWMFAPRHPKETIKAEFPLKADRLVIVPYAGTDILFNDPTAALEVSTGLVNEILRNMSAQVKTIVHPVQVARWQESNIEWPNMPLADIAKAFQADTLLYVELERYTMMEDRSANLFRGRARARIQVVQPAAERNPVYETIVEATFPEDRPVGVLETSEQTIRAGTNMYFARTVIGKFHDHEVEVTGGRK